jgi:EAL domain-containing protein (putative c-di-GMP-specific phosphodiesterase class I)
MSQTVIEALNGKMQDAFLDDFTQYLNLDKFGRYTGLYRGFTLDSVFQPITSGNDQHTIGYEALLRPSIGTALPVEPKFVFRYIDETGGLVLFDRICRTLHLLNFLAFKQEQDLLFINVHPALLTKVDTHGKIFEAIVHAHSVPVEKVVIELEESYLEHQQALDKALRNFRDRGFKIAISDFGRELTYVKRLWNITPDFVKLHIDLLREAVASEKVAKILPKVVDLIHQAGGEVVVQGIESARQLAIAEQSGARFRQGFALSRPEPAAHWLEQLGKGEANLRRYASG